MSSQHLRARRVLALDRTLPVVDAARRVVGALRVERHEVEPRRRSRPSRRSGPTRSARGTAAGSRGPTASAGPVVPGPPIRTDGRARTRPGHGVVVEAAVVLERAPASSSGCSARSTPRTTSAPPRRARSARRSGRRSARRGPPSARSRAAGASRGHPPRRSPPRRPATSRRRPPSTGTRSRGQEPELHDRAEPGADDHVVQAVDDRPVVDRPTRPAPPGTRWSTRGPARTARCRWSARCGSARGTAPRPGPGASGSSARPRPV